MNCTEMMQIHELQDVLQLRAGESGLHRAVRWIYFADTLECVKTEYRAENYIHGGEFVVLTSRSVTDDVQRLMTIITQMCALDIAALGINEGQISEALVEYCNAQSLPLFELPEAYPLVDLSLVLCQRLVLEENVHNSAEQLLSSILDADHLSRESVYAQARYLNVDLSGYFCVVEFAFSLRQRSASAGEQARQESQWAGDYLALGQAIRRIINSEFSHRMSQNILTQLQTSAILALIPVGKMSTNAFQDVLDQIVRRVRTECHTHVVIGVGDSVSSLEDVRQSRNEAAAAIRIADVADTGQSIIYYRDQGLYTLLSHIPDGRFLDEFVDKYIGRLLSADEVNEGHLCETLETYLAHNCNAKEAAAAMYIHRGTMNYRLNKIWEILGQEYKGLDACATLRLAFMIRGMRE